MPHPFFFSLYSFCVSSLSLFFFFSLLMKVSKVSHHHRKRRKMINYFQKKYHVSYSVLFCILYFVLKKERNERNHSFLFLYSYLCLFCFSPIFLYTDSRKKQYQMLYLGHFFPAIFFSKSVQVRKYKKDSIIYLRHFFPSFIFFLCNFLKFF